MLVAAAHHTRTENTVVRPAKSTGGTSRADCSPSPLEYSAAGAVIEEGARKATHGGPSWISRLLAPVSIALEKIRTAFKDQVDLFINAYLAVNPKDAK